ncbi:MAG: arylsulfatase A-like enzyme [Myxococcota bacterium]
MEATDTEIGRVLSSIPPDVLARTTIIYLSDNGTPGGAITAPWDDTRGKGTLYEGGVNVPMIVTGPLVAQPGRTSDALVHFVDFFPTFAELAEVPLDDPRAGFALELDGVSFLPTLLDPDAGSAREIVYSEKFYPNGAPPYDYHHRMVTDGQWKLIRKDEDGEVTEELYRLEGWQDGDDRMGELETDPEAAEAHDRLGASMAEHIETLAFEY